MDPVAASGATSPLRRSSSPSPAVDPPDAAVHTHESSFIPIVAGTGDDRSPSPVGLVPPAPHCLPALGDSTPVYMRGTYGAAADRALEDHQQHPAWRAFAEACAKDPIDAVGRKTHGLALLRALSTLRAAVSAAKPSAQGPQGRRFSGIRAYATRVETTALRITGPSSAPRRVQLQAALAFIRMADRPELVDVLHTPILRTLAQAPCWLALAETLAAIPFDPAACEQAILAGVRALAAAEDQVQDFAPDGDISALPGTTSCFLEATKSTLIRISRLNREEPFQANALCLPAWLLFAQLHRDDAFTALTNGLPDEACIAGPKSARALTANSFAFSHSDGHAVRAAIEALVDRAEAYRAALAAEMLPWPVEDARWAQLSRWVFTVPDQASDLATGLCDETETALDRVEDLGVGGHRSEPRDRIRDQLARAVADLDVLLTPLRPDVSHASPWLAKTAGAIIRLLARTGRVDALEAVLRPRTPPLEISKPAWREIIRDALQDPSAETHLASPGDVALHAAMDAPEGVRDRILGQLLEDTAYGIQVDTPGSDGDTALHRAGGLRDGGPSTIQVLLAHGADPKARTRGGQTARDLLLIRSPSSRVEAAMEGWWAVPTRLAGADSVTADALSGTPLRSPTCEAAWTLLNEARLVGPPGLRVDYDHPSVPPGLRAGYAAAAVGWAAAAWTCVHPAPNDPQQAAEHGPPDFETWRATSEHRRHAVAALPAGTPSGGAAWMEAVAASAEVTRQGDCFSHASVAFRAITTSRWRDVTAEMLVIGPHGDTHRCLVLNRGASGAGSQHRSADARLWAREAVICDPWWGAIYPASEWSRRANLVYPDLPYWVVPLS